MSVGVVPDGAALEPQWVEATMRTKMTATSLLVRARLLTWLWVVLSALAVGAAVDSAEAATFTVVSTADTDDPHPGDGQCGGVVISGWFLRIYPCTLRAAITEINHLPPPVPGTQHTINFNIGYGVQTISPASALPTITQPVVIDGSTQQILLVSAVMSGPRTIPCMKRGGGPCIQLNGAAAGSSDGLTLAGGNSTVSGLAIYNFGASGIHVMSDNNLINGNFIGTDHSGTYALPNKQHGVLVCGSSLTSDPATSSCSPARNNVIHANLISGNGQSGVVIDATGSTENFPTFLAVRTLNQVRGNCIGTDATCTALVPNGAYGVTIVNASQNYIGSDAAGNVEGNVIGGNFYGVGICGGQLSTTGFSCNGGNVAVGYNKVLGNYIGTNWAGANLGNGQQGIDLGGGVSLGCPPGAQNCVIATEVGGNVVSNNLTGGILNSYAAGGNIHDNTALHNGGADLDEENPFPYCGNDTWTNNTFQTKSGAGAACIP